MPLRGLTTGSQWLTHRRITFTCPRTCRISSRDHILQVPNIGLNNYMVSIYKTVIFTVIVSCLWRLFPVVANDCFYISFLPANALCASKSTKIDSNNIACNLEHFRDIIRGHPVLVCEYSLSKFHDEEWLSGCNVFLKKEAGTPVEMNVRLYSDSQRKW